MKSESSNVMYADRQLWNDYNAVAEVPLFDGAMPRSGATHDALWTIAENLVVGAAQAVRRTPT